MSLDAICLRAVLHEMRSELLGARIDKVQQPARDQIILLVRGKERVLINAGPNQPRIQFTKIVRDNPAQPPMFCMLLRKHLVGARILSIEQPDMERAVIMTLQSTNELGECGERKLILECMGRRSNLILLDADGRIIDCLRRVDFEISSDRQLLPGLYYHLPSPLNRLSLLTQREDSLALCHQGGDAAQQVDQWILDHFTGISPLIAREIALEIGGSTDVRFNALTETQRNALPSSIESLADTINYNSYTPTILLRDGKPVDFTYRTIRQYGAETSVEVRESFSALLDEFYEKREMQELQQRRGRELIKIASNARDRMARKAENLRRDYATTQDRDALRLRGDLITSNLYRMESGMTRFITENFFEPDCPQIEITLDPLLTPQQNAAKYYKQYNKAKSAEYHLREQIEKAEREKEYLESVLQEISQSTSESEFAEIRHELQETGYIRRGKEKHELKRSFAPLEYRSANGYRIIVGRNNVQNDQITHKADKRDYWFHTQKIHGAHVILCCGAEKPQEADIRDAAILSAYYSQAQLSGSVPVDFTNVKFVKKPAGARPGMVIYNTFQTVFVTPDKAAVEALKK